MRGASYFAGAALIAGLGFGLAAWLEPARQDTDGNPSAISVTEVLQARSGEGFRPIEPPLTLIFPQDHGPHRDQQIEWWYFTGNLEADDGRTFGFQLTFFRIGLVAEASNRQSAWAATEQYMAHFALTDAEGQAFLAHERTARGALGLAGAQADPFRVWTETWSASSEGSSYFPLRLRAAADEVSMDLSLTTDRAPVLQGDGGYSAKGGDPGNASAYVSFTRLDIQGRLVLGGEPVAVRGLGWMDHEWSTSVLGTDLAGWDWFSLHLEDGRDLMIYLLRRKDGTSSPFSAGTLVEASGAVRALGPDDFEVLVHDHWTSPETGARYPAHWTLSVPSARLTLNLKPRIAAQELVFGMSYWEGAVQSTGGLAAQGYVELVGY
ncbi:MAG: carotenoid 1,2-hydratase [Planctomycetes bacterium]|nr:carotenoid 1,2-hydratase [Planctomycetota bacterium]